MDRKDPHFVRNDSDKRLGRSFALKEAFKCAGRGFIYVAATQRNMKIHALFIALAIVLGLVLSIPAGSWFAVLICIGMVLTAECVNTALESIVDLVSPAYAELAKHAKDCAAAGVLVCAAVSLIVGICVYGGAVVNAVAPGVWPL